MPSPFPGMDPYLEDPRLWRDVHLNLISAIQQVLSGPLRPKYVVRVEERVYVSHENDPGRSAIFPDVQVVERPGMGGSRWPEGLEWEWGDAPSNTAEPVVVTTLIEDEIHEAYLRVIDLERRSTVAMIEVLSPTNKVAGSRGRRSFLRKRREVMTSGSHFVEIDLLRGGVPLRAREIFPECEYLVHVSKVDARPRATVWPIRLSQRLPIVPIPLRPEDGEVPLDLQEVLTIIFDRAGYDLDIDYQKEAVPPLAGDWAEWTDRLLRTRGLRP